MYYTEYRPAVLAKKVFLKFHKKRLKKRRVDDQDNTIIVLGTRNSVIIIECWTLQNNYKVLSFPYIFLMSFCLANNYYNSNQKWSSLSH